MSTRFPRGSSPAQESDTCGPPVPDGTKPTEWASYARLLLRIDGTFEALLGALLILSPITGLYTKLNLPAPAWKPLVVGFGLLLLPLLPLLWLISRAPRRELMLALAGANCAGALVFILWVALWHEAFNGAGAALVLAVAAVLAILATLQARAALAA